MRISAVLLFAVLLAACANSPDLVFCDFSPDQIVLIRSNARAFLEKELGEDFIYYDSEDSVTDSIAKSGGMCGVIVAPMGEPDAGGTILHGEGVVHFDPGTLEPDNLAYFRW